MQRVLDNLLNQVLVYWPKGTVTRSGEYQVGDPVEVTCRWETTYQELTDAEGSTFISQAQIWMRTQALDLDGWVWLSSARPSDPPGTALSQAPSDPPSNQVVRTLGIIPSTRNTEIVYTAAI